MALQLNMAKAQESAGKLKLAMVKKGIATPPEVDVAFDLDVSGSFEDEHKDGTTTMLMHRLIPWGLVFDPDKKLDVFTFSSGEGSAHYVGDVKAETADDYVSRKIINKVPRWNGGTEYSRVLHLNLQHFGWEDLPQAAAQKSGGFFGGLFGSKPAPQKPAQNPRRKSIVLFITDGENTDKDATSRLLKLMQDRGDQVYIQFVGIEQPGSSDFHFLQRVADQYSNTGLVIVQDVRNWVKKTDEELNELLITDEFVKWLKAA